MRKATLDRLLTAILLGALISNGYAATAESGNDPTSTPSGSTSKTPPPETGAPSDTLPAEPGTASDVKVSPESVSGEDAASKRLRAAAQAKAEREKAEEEKKKNVTKRSEFWGGYVGMKFGIVNSSASGTVYAPSASLFAYGVQGGFLQAGYNWDLKSIIVGLGTYYDVNPNAIHSNQIGYSSRAYGLDFKLGLPVNFWLPYAKLGYGRSLATSNSDLNRVSQYGSNAAVGIEYNVASRWSVIAEFKIDKFSDKQKTITIHNRLFTLGFNYYYDKPLEDNTAKAVEVDLPIPPPLIDPKAVPEAPPEP